MIKRSSSAATPEGELEQVPATQTAPASQDRYHAFVFGLQVAEFRLGTPVATLTFNVLVVAAVLVIVGVFLALWRRARDRGALAVQTQAQTRVSK